MDDPQKLGAIVAALGWLADRLPLVFPVHPRTRQQLERFGLLEQLEAHKRIILLPPAAYLDFLSLITDARLLLTDSGGVRRRRPTSAFPA